MSKIPKKRVKQNQSARLFLRESDHRDIVYQDCYHNAIYLNKDTFPSWRKYKKKLVLLPCGSPTGTYGRNVYYSSIDVDNQIVSAHSGVFSSQYYCTHFDGDGFHVMYDLNGSTHSFYITTNGYDYVRRTYSLTGYFLGIFAKNKLLFINRPSASYTITLYVAEIVISDNNIQLNSVTSFSYTSGCYFNKSTRVLCNNYYDDSCVFAFSHYNPSSTSQNWGNRAFKVTYNDGEYSIQELTNTISQSGTYTYSFLLDDDGLYKDFNGSYVSSSQTCTTFRYSSDGMNWTTKQIAISGNYILYSVSAVIKSSKGIYVYSYRQNGSSSGLIKCTKINGIETTEIPLPDYIDVPIKTDLGCPISRSNNSYTHIRIYFDTSKSIPNHDGYYKLNPLKFNIYSNHTSGFIDDGNIENCGIKKDYLILMSIDRIDGNYAQIYINNNVFAEDEKNFAFLTNSYIDANGKDTVEPDDYVFGLTQSESEV